MTTIRLNRNDHTLEVADSSEDIDQGILSFFSYDVSYVVNCGGGWVDFYNEHGIMMGFVTAVKNVEERW